MVLVSLAWPWLATAAETKTINFDVPAASAEKSLRVFSRQSGIEVVFASEVARGVQTRPVKGETTPRQALEAMLQGTMLQVVEDETGAFSIRRKPATTQTTEPPSNSKKKKMNPNDQ